MAEEPRGGRGWLPTGWQEAVCRVASVFFAGACVVMLITGEPDVEPKIPLVFIALFTIYAIGGNRLWLRLGFSRLRK